MDKNVDKPPFPECDYITWFKNEMLIHGCVAWDACARWAWDKAQEEKRGDDQEWNFQSDNAI